ncbi:hypothetical protein [Clostridium sp. B9]
MLKKILKEFFCKHEYESFILKEPFYITNSEGVFTKCKKCGKIKRGVWK